MSIEGLKEQARRHEQREEWKQALALDRRAIEHLAQEEQPDIALYNRVGDLCVRVKDLDRAVQHYEQAVDLYLEAELPNNAIAVCKKIVRSMPSRSSVYLKMGRIRAGQGFLTDARQNFLTYAERTQASGNMDEALRALMEFADLSPADVEIRLAVARQLEQHQRREEALAQLGAAYDTLVARGDAEQAGEVEARIRELDPGAALGGKPAAGAFETTALRDDDAIGGDFGEIVLAGEPADAEEQEGSAEGGGTEAGGGFEITLREEEPLSPSDSPARAGAAGLAGGEGPEALGGEAEPAGREEEAPEPLPTFDLGEEEEAEPLPTFPLGEEGAEPLPTLDAEGGEGEAEPTPAFSLEDEEGAEALPLYGLEENEEEAEPLPTFDPGEEEEEAEPLPTFDLGEEEEGEAEPLAAFERGEGEEAGEPQPLPTFEPEPAEEEGGRDRIPAFAIEEDEGEPAGPLPGEVGTGPFHALEEEAPEPLTAAQFGESDRGDREGEEYVTPGAEMGEVEVGDLSLEGAEEAAEARRDALEAAAFERRAEAEEAGPADAVEGLLSEGRLDEAEAIVRERMAREPEHIAHCQRLVELAYRRNDPRALAAAWVELARTLERTGSEAQARSVYQQVLSLDPENGPARAALAGAQAGGSTPPVSRVASSDDYVDLGSLIFDEEEEKTTRFRVAYEEPTGDESRDFARMLSQFKAKVAENIDIDDVRAHHDLGTAYKEMGLIDEAIEEFQAALRASRDHLPTHELLGQCFLLKGQPEAAVKSLSRALNVPFDIEDELLGIYYYLGRAHEALGNTASAAEFYDRVFSLDINFMDVTERLRALR